MADRLYDQGGTDTEAFVPAPANPLGGWAPRPYSAFEGAPQALPSSDPYAYPGGAQPFNPLLKQPATPPAPAENPNYALARNVANIAGSASAGFGSGSQVEATPYAGDAALQTVSAGLQGAASGAALGTMIAPGVGTAIGAGVGTVVGLVTGGINSYMGLRRARAQRRQQERQQAEIRKMQKEEQEYNRMIAGRDRGDELEKIRYNRHIARVQSQWAAHNAALSRVNDVLRTNAEFRDAFIRGQR